MRRPLMLRNALVAPVAAALMLSACTTTPYTGPIEVTRFVAEAPNGLGQGPITIYFPEEVSNASAKAATKAAVERELQALGYTIVAQEGRGIQVAAVRTSRTPIAAAEQRQRQRGPVDVGIGGGTGGFGSGVGLGAGINLGGGREGPAAMTELSVRITGDDAKSLWEGRSQIATGVKSPYSQVETSARTLSAALFRDFPGGNGETVMIDAKKLQGTK